MINELIKIYKIDSLVIKRVLNNIIAYMLAITTALIALDLVYLLLDVMGFMAWVLSSQTPEGFYLGKITCEILKAIVL